MSQRHLPTGPHAVTGVMLRRDASRNAAMASAMVESAGAQPPGEEQINLTAEQGQFLRKQLVDNASGAEEWLHWPFAKSLEQLKREADG